MHVLAGCERSAFPSKVIGPLALAAILLCGCAVERVGEVRRPGSHCRMNTVAYCELEVAAPTRCQCVWQGQVRQMLRGLSTR